MGLSLARVRQEFIKNELMCDSGNLKTLAQFVLFGDPSTAPCMAATSEFQNPTFRIQLANDGLAIARAAVVAGGPTIEGTASLSKTTRESLLAIAKERGYSGLLQETINKCKGWAPIETRAAAEQFVVTISSKLDHRYIVAYIVGDEIIRVEESASH